MRKFRCTLYLGQESNLEEDPRETDTEGHLPLSSPPPSPGCVKGKEGIHKGGYDFKGGTSGIFSCGPCTIQMSVCCLIKVS